MTPSAQIARTKLRSTQSKSLNETSLRISGLRAAPWPGRAPNEGPRFLPNSSLQRELSPDTDRSETRHREDAADRVAQARHLQACARARPPGPNPDRPYR